MRAIYKTDIFEKSSPTQDLDKIKSTTSFKACIQSSLTSKLEST